MTECGVLPGPPENPAFLAFSGVLTVNDDERNQMKLGDRILGWSIAAGMSVGIWAMIATAILYFAN